MWGLVRLDLEFGTARIASLVEDLWDTMAARGGIGLAATQIGEPSRVVVFGMESSARYPHAHVIPRTVLINPVIEPLDDEMEEAWEGCLSVPGMRGLVSLAAEALVTSVSITAG